MFSFLPKSKSSDFDKKVSAAEQRYLDLRSRETELEFKIKTMENDLQLKRQTTDLELEKLKHKHDLEMKTLKSEIEQTKKLSNEKIVHEAELTKKKFEVEKNEYQIVSKLEKEQQLAQMKVDYDKKSNELIAKHQKEMNEFQRKTLEDNYKMLNESLTKMNTDGNAQTKFVQDLSMKMMEKVPALSSSAHTVHIEKTVNGSDTVDTPTKKK